MPNVEKCEVICCSYYDDKPFHMMGNTTGGVTVIEFHRKCFSTATQVHRGCEGGGGRGGCAHAMLMRARVHAGALLGAG